MTSADEAIVTNVQHTKPCHDCPWRRKSIAGWLGGFSAWTWIRAAHGDEQIKCHALEGPQCVGAATYRANVAKLPRGEHIKCSADRKQVFATPAEFMEHHEPKAK